MTAETDRDRGENQNRPGSARRVPAQQGTRAAQEASGPTGAPGDGTWWDDGAPRVHAATCACEDCPLGARAAYRRATAEFAARRDQYAAGQGVPEALAHSPEASRQWVSDELTRAAQSVAVRAQEAGAAWLHVLARRTVRTLWALVGMMLLIQLVTALGGGWTRSRYVALIAAVVVAGLCTLAARLHRRTGGLFAPLVGADHRLSTSRAVAVGWLLLTLYTGLLLALTLAATGDPAEREALLDGLGLREAAGLLTVLVLALFAALWVRHSVARRVRKFRMQKVSAARPRAADLLTDDAGRGSFTDLTYLSTHLVGMVFTAVALGRAPREIPQLPWPLVCLAAIGTLGYLAGKYAEGGRPVILSVVRSREPGELPVPVRPGDTIEIRGSGFVPAGAQEPDRLAETVVRVGEVYVPVPLIPCAGGFTNPADTLLRVPVPVEVDAGLVDVRVITASGAESGRYPISVAE